MSKSAAAQLKGRLRKIFEDLKSHPEITPFLHHEQQLYERVRTARVDTPMDLNTIENKLNTYSTLDDFSSDVRSMWENLMKFHGRRSAYTRACKSLAEHFEQLLAADANRSTLSKPSSRKGKPDSNPNPKPEKLSEKAESNPSPRPRGVSKQASFDDTLAVDAEARNKLRKVMTSLMEHALAEPFNTLPKESDAPGYYDKIQQYMDFPTIKKQIRSYTNIRDFLNDVSRVWENCQKYYPKTSDMVTQASALQTFFQNKMTEEFPQILTLFTSNKKSKRPHAKTLALADTNIPHTHLKEDKRDGSASTYMSSNVETEQGLGVGKRAKRPKSFIEDFQQEESSVGDRARYSHKAVSSSFVTVSTDTHARLPRSSAGTGESNAGGEAKANRKRGRKSTPGSMFESADTDTFAEVSGSVRPKKVARSTKQQLQNSATLASGSASELLPKMKKIIQTLMRDDRSLPFHFPINESDAPGYFKVISKPMDLSTISANVNKYQENPEAFYKDMNLIWDNCKLYNDPHSHIWKWADELSKKFDALYTAAVGNSEKAMIRQLFEDVRNHEHAGPFLEPVDPKAAPGYLEIIQTPMDISTIRTKLDSYGDMRSFVADVKLVFENAKKYNRSDSTLYAMADELLTFFKERIAIVKKKFQVQRETPRTENSYTDVSAPHRASHPKSKPSHKQTPRTENSYTDVSAPHPASHPKPKPSHKQTPRTESSSTDVSEPNLASSPKPKSSHKQAKEPRGDTNPNPDTSNLTPKSKPNAPAPPETLPGIDTNSKCKSKIKTNPSKNFKNEAATGPKQYSKSSKRQYTTSQSELLKNAAVLEGSRGTTAAIVRKAANQQASDFTRKLHFPWVVEGYTVLDLGTIKPDPEFYSQSCIYPIQYSVEKALWLRIHNPSLTEDTDIVRLIPVTFKSYIEDNDSEPLFKVMVGESVVSENFHPLNAWKGAMRQLHGVISVLGSSMRHCRAVLNHLCVHTSPSIMPFLQEIRTQHYSRVIEAPMWLAEVHDRLLGGYYNSEFEFAEDVRFVFRNCKKYNTEGSELWGDADKLEDVFNELFCDWVLNIHDVSVTDFARGPWDEWTYLRYFDATDEDNNVCRVTGVRYAEEMLLFCASCEDQYLPSALGVDTSELGNDGWICSRCSKAAQAADRQPDSPKYKSKCVWSPRKDMGSGWMKRLGAGGFLSPLGTVCRSKTEIEEEQQRCASTQEDWKQQRAREYKISRKSTKSKEPAKDKEHHNDLIRPKRNRHAQKALGEIFVPLPVGRIPRAKSVVSVEDDLSVRQPFEVIKRSAIPYLNFGLDDALDLAELDGEDVIPVQLGEFGFFGLETSSIRHAIEGLDKAGICEGYEFQKASTIRDEMLSEVYSLKDKGVAAQDAGNGLGRAVANERWKYKRAMDSHRSRTVVIQSTKTQPRQPLTEYKPLPFTQFTEVEGEWLVMIWEFMTFLKRDPDAIDIRLSLTEIVEALGYQGSGDEPTFELPCVASVYFDELCTILVKYLLREIRSILLERSDRDWFQLLALKPLNCMTWQVLAHQLLVILSQYRYNDQYNSSDALRALRTSLAYNMVVCEDILCLLVVHPLIEPFMDPVDPNVVIGYSEVVKMPMDINTVRRRIHGYDNPQQFFHDVSLIFTNAKAYNPPSSDIFIAAKKLLAYFRYLFSKWVICNPRISLEIQQACKADMRTPEFNSHTSHPTFWGMEQSTMFASAVTSDWNSSHTSPSVFGYSICPDMEELCVCGYLHRLERVLQTLRDSDSETWTKGARFAVAAGLIDECLTTASFRQLIAKDNTAVDDDTNENDVLDLVQQLPSPLEDNLERLRPSSTYVCMYSGLTPATSPKDSWVLVPDDFIQNNKSKSRPVALERCMQEVARARAAANQEAVDLDKSLSVTLRAWGTQGAEDTGRVNQPAVFRTQPVGHDRAGNEYWILSGASRGLITSVGLTNEGARDKWCVFVRTSRGRWGMYRGKKDVVMLLDILSDTYECEKYLRRTMVSELQVVTVEKLEDLEKHRIWYAHRKNILQWLRSFSPAQLRLMPIVDACKFLELMWARCVETRLGIHYASLQEPLRALSDSFGKEGKETNSEKKKGRDLLVLETMDFHPTKGWLRFDAFASVRELSACTTADRLLGDSNLASYIAHQMSKSKGRRQAASGYENAVDVGPNANQTKRRRKSQISFAEELSDDDGRVNKSLDSTPSNRPRPVDQVDLKTGQVLKRWSSAREAFVQIGVSQHIVSSCCRGLRKDAYNCGWRFPEDTPPGTEILDLDISTLAELTSKKKAKSIPSKSPNPDSRADDDGLDDPQSSQVEVTIGSILPRLGIGLGLGLGSASTVGLGLGGSSNQQTTTARPEARIPKSDMMASTVLVSARMCKLKSEMLNLACVINPARLSWQTQALVVPNASVTGLVQSSTASEAVGGTSSNVPDATFRDWVARVQRAPTPDALLSCVREYEEAIPQDTLHTYYLPKAFPAQAMTVAAVAIRVYALDRCMRYEEANKFEWNETDAHFKPRTSLTPRCIVQPQCIKPLGHWGRCNQYGEMSSRHRDIVVPPAPLPQYHEESYRRSTSTASSNIYGSKSQQAAAQEAHPSQRKKRTYVGHSSNPNPNPNPIPLNPNPNPFPMASRTLGFMHSLNPSLSFNINPSFMFNPNPNPNPNPRPKSPTPVVPAPEEIQESAWI